MKCHDLGDFQHNKNKTNYLASQIDQCNLCLGMNTFEGSTDFSFQTQVLQFVSIFSNENPFNDQYLLHLCSENCEINFGNSNSPRAFQQHREHFQIPLQFSVSILFTFSLKKMFQQSIPSRTVAPNNLKPSWCNPTYQEIFKNTKRST